MMKRTHVAIGLAATLPIIIHDPMTAIGVFGATFPDIDYMIGIPHRTLTHSLLALIASSVVVLLYSVLKLL